MERKETEKESFLNPEEKVRVEKEQKGRKCILCRIDYGACFLQEGLFRMMDAVFFQSSSTCYVLVYLHSNVRMKSESK